MGTDSTLILADEHHSRNDLQLLRKAVRKSWPVTRRIKRRAVKATADLIDHDNPYVQLAAIGALIQMDRADIAADKATAPTTQNNTQVNVYMPANSRESAADLSGSGGSNATISPPSPPNPVRVREGDSEPLSCEIVQD